MTSTERASQPGSEGIWPYLHDGFGVLPQTRQVVSCPQALHREGETLQDRRGSPESQALPLHHAEFIAFCQHLKGILRGEVNGEHRNKEVQT